MIWNTFVPVNQTTQNYRIMKNVTLVFMAVVGMFFLFQPSANAVMNTVSSFEIVDNNDGDPEKKCKKCDSKCSDENCTAKCKKECTKEDCKKECSKKDCTKASCSKDGASNCCKSSTCADKKECSKKSCEKKCTGSSEKTSDDEKC